MSYGSGRRNPSSTTPTKLPGLPKLPANISAEVRAYLVALGEALEIRLGRKGDPQDRAVTVRELSDGTLARTTISAGSVTTSSASGTSSGGGVTVQTPTAPTGFQVTAGFSNISLRWNWPTSSNQYSGHSFTEVWRHTSDVLSSATLTGSSAGSTFTDYVGGGQTYYYWIRHVNTNNVAGPYNASAGTAATTVADTPYLTSLLASAITSSELATSLSTPIAKIPGIETFTGYTTSYSGNNLLTRVGSVETASNTAASDITALEATVFEADGTTPKISAAAVTALTTEVFPNGTASASSIDTLSTGYSDPDGSGSSVTLQQAMSTQLTLNGTLKAQYTVKIDAAGTIAGFGLANTTTTSTPFSEFYVRADNFALLPPSTTVTSFPTTGNYQNRTVYRSDLNETYYYDTSSSNWVTSPSSLPFVVATSPQTLQGETVPAGVYIDTAYMNKGRVLDLVAGSVVADYMSATVAMDAPYLFGGTINVGQINKPTSDPRDWTVSGTTRVSNFSVDANGVMHANSAVMEGITIKAPDGTVLVDAGGMTGGSGGNLVYNGNFKRGALTFNAGTSTWSEDTQDTDGFVNYNGTVLERRDLGYIRAGDNSTGVGYVRSNKQRFPVNAGETLYVYAQTGSTAGAWMAVAYYNQSDGTDTNGYITQTSVATSNTDFDDKAVTVGGVTRRSLIAAVTVPSTSGADYAEVRFGSNTGAHVYFYNVGVSRTPPELGPKYVATYIRDLSVDTLQIANNAVTVPLSAQYGAMSSYVGQGTETVVNGTPLTVDFGTNVPTQVLLMALCDLQSSGLGGDWAAAVLRLRYNTTSSTTISGSIAVEGVQVNSRKGAPPSLNLSKSINGWTGARYFFLTLEVGGEQGSAAGWWKASDANITVLGARK